jgi:aminopeptidase N
VAAIATAMVLSTSAASAARIDQKAMPEVVDGAAGVGDPYFPKYGNGGYDVRHYRIGIAYRPASERLIGRTVIRAVATKSLRRFNLDLQLRSVAVRVDRRPALYRQDGRELVVRPRRPLRAGEPFRVVVAYRGVPGEIRSNGAVPWVETDDGAVVAGAPESATVWYPSNDHPRDKASFDLVIRTRSGLDVVSNGRLVDKRRGGRWTTWHWRQRSPMATYLAFAAFGDFTYLRGRTRAGTPYLYALSDHLGWRRRAAATSIRRTADITDFYGRRFGSYPFGVTGGVVVDARLGFAIETQTRPVYEKYFFYDRPNPGIVAHEIAHQWFGDYVSVDRWRDAWLNEGFATWASWLYGEKRRSPNANARFASAWRFFRDDRQMWRVPVANPGRERVFPPAIYMRGAMALQGLRNTIGHRDFMALLRT